MIDITKINPVYKTRYLDEKDITDIFNLCKENKLFYEHHPPFVTKESIYDDMKTLPEAKDYKDKHYFGFYENNKLISIMDLIDNYPENNTAFIGFFMLDIQYQNKNIASNIIDDLCIYLKNQGYEYLKLGYIRSNPQASYFWIKNNFKEYKQINNKTNTIIMAERRL